MECVEAIKESKHITLMKEHLKKQSLRDYLFFVMGINTGIRINELLHIKVSEVIEDNGCVKEFYISIVDEQSIYINNIVQNAITIYVQSEKLESSDYLFKSRKCEKPISRQQAYRIVNNAANNVGLYGKIGTHTLRKTFGYHAYKKGIAVSILQSLFNHNTPSETYRYIGINKDDKNDNNTLKIDVNL
ncbi:MULTISPECIES: tyrosine-type recombinase/integrase [Bacillus]|uniref:tyrosine-type recombinase/integrase n=1 Tax=Bacillus TaxID=1386 RepID=UPI000BB78826|nr:MULTISPECIES: tyrosine-type recombinase/integrase [Bacillus]